MPAEQLEVWLDAQFCVKPMLVGFISNDHGQLRFQYSQNWLTDSSRFAIDPDLPLSQGVYFPNKDAGNFGCFLDGSPDRWGRSPESKLYSERWLVVDCEVSITRR
jgi:serine/threonine-protein kinase HipA